MTGERILVVDDEKAVRDAFVTSFDEYRVLAVASASEALDILSRPNSIDVIFADVVMPNISGIELLAKIKAINPEYKVVIFTAYSSKDALIEALRLHADDYVEKPFDVEKTRNVIEKMLSLKAAVDKRSKNPTNKIELAQRFIQRNYTKKISLKDVASEICLSPKYFSRIFKEKTGKTFNQYRIELRIKFAKLLLKEHHDTVSQIACKVGYENPESFIKIFKKATGNYPSQYRKFSKK